ncbi:MAG: hypothetical protein V1887_01830 [Candidatus Aenigmatarchaeota archaeon]
MEMDAAYRKLERKYAELKIRYKNLRARYERRLPTRKRVALVSKRSLVIPFLVIAVFGIVWYHHPVIFIMGALISAGELVMELYATKNGRWNYENSVHMIAGRVPIGIPVFYFFSGASLATFVLVRMFGL